MSKYLPDQSTIHCRARLNRLRGFLLVFASIVGISLSSFGQAPPCGCEDLMTLCSEGNDSSCDTWVTWCDFESYCDCMETLDDEAWCTMQFPPVTFCVNVDECQVASVSVSGPSSADMSSAPIVFSAQGFTQGGSPINGNGTWTWSTTNGTISGNGSTGYLYPTTSGTVQVTATFQESTQNCGPVSGSTSIAITDICPAIVSVSGPSTAEYWSGLPVGPYTAQAYTQSFAPVSGGTWVWSSTNGAMSGSGAVAYLYPASPGTATVGATVQVSGCGNASGSMPVNIVCPSVSVSITGPSVVLAGGTAKTYYATVNPPTSGTFEWSVAGCSGSSCTFSPPSSPQQINIQATFHPSSSCPPTTSILSIDVVKIDFITPAGDPVVSPVQSGDGQNEFTFSAASPGVLTISLKARVTPSGKANQIKEQVRFTVEEVGDSTSAWDTANPGGQPATSGDYLIATITFAGLPTQNSGFGAKKAGVYLNDEKGDEKDYEVFYPRDASNHPGGHAGDPNWFYYWSQVYGTANLKYSNNSTFDGFVLGMIDWRYQAAPDKTNIYIGNTQPTAGRSYSVGEMFSGIDYFIATVIHEDKHVAQIQLADQLLPTSGYDSFRYGWSWNRQTHNHWQKGADGQWGVAGVDDDNNGTFDDAVTIPPFEPGFGDDASLDHPTYPDWPSSWTLPNPIIVPDNPIESEAVNHADTSMNENDYVDQD